MDILNAKALQNGLYAALVDGQRTGSFLLLVAGMTKGSFRAGLCDLQTVV